MLRFLFRLPLLLLFASFLHAQTVRWTPGEGTLAFGQANELRLVFEDCQPKDSYTAPAVPGLVFGNPSYARNASFSVVNGRAVSINQVVLSYGVRPTEHTTIAIPEFTVETDKGPLRVAAAKFEVKDATVGETGLKPADIARSSFQVPTNGVWAGEVFPISYTLNVADRYFYQLASHPDWNNAPLSIEPLTKPEASKANINDELRQLVTYSTRAIVKTPGDYALNPATQFVYVLTGGGGGMFRQDYVQIATTTPRTDLTVRALPPSPYASFAGAVGKFALTSKVVPQTVAVGEPITWTLTLSGTGNWPDVQGVPPRSLSKDFRVVQPESKRTNKDNKIYDAELTEDLILIPTQPGTYTLGSVQLPVFNPSTGTYELLKTPAVTVTVTPSAHSAAANPASGSANNANSATGANPANVSATPAKPDLPPAAINAIPRDPLPLAGKTLAPFAPQIVWWTFGAALLLPLVTWFAFALGRARITDTRRGQREARIRISDTLRSLGSAPDAEQTAALIRRWQRDVAILWQLPQAVPTPADFRETDQAWATLWAESERALYGNVPLPTDWISRASLAASARRVPAFSAFQLFFPRNLLPIVIVLASIALSHSALAQQTAGNEAYAKGDFDTAEAKWSEAIKAAPTDWTAQHNLALTLIQKNRAGEAAGHALAAFVQKPDNASTRWHLAFAFKSAAVAPTELQPFLNDTPAGTIARLAAPACWQLILVSAGWLAAVALAFAARAAYRKRGYIALTGAVLSLSFTLAAASVISLHTYGPLKDTRAAMVVTPATLRSIPTDLDTQKTSALSVGSIAAVEETLLGWSRVRFPNGQTGWVRTENLVSLWK